jgi:mersacidin/lichenicidin family type 2 lantibiotic
MTVEKIVRAWRDPLFRSGLGAAEQALVPDNPAGMIELHGTALDAVAGASGVAGTGSSGTGTGSSGSGKSSKSHKSHKSH